MTGVYLRRRLTVWAIAWVISLGMFIWLNLPVLWAQSGPAEDERVLRIGGNADFMPFEFLNANGDPAGYTVDLINAVAGKMGLKIIISMGPWNQIRRQLEERQIDALTGVLYSKVRDRFLDFSAPHMVFSYAIFVRKGSPFKTAPELKGKSILVVEDVYAHDWLRSHDVTSRIFPVETPEEALQLLSRGKHDFALLPRLHGLDMLRRLNIDNLETRGPPVLTQKFCFAVASGNADLLAQLNEGLLLIQKSGEYDRIYQKWFSVYEQRQLLFKYAAWIGLPLLALVTAGLLWNISLKRTVSRKTRQLRENQTMLDQIIQGLPMPTFVVDRHQKVTHWNHACETLTGVSAAQMIGTPKHKEVFYNDLRPVMSDTLLNPAAENGGQMSPLAGLYGHYFSMAEGLCQAEFNFSHFDGKSKWLCGTAALVHDESGEVVGAIECWQDLTGRKQLESQLIQSQKMQAIGTLAAGIAHDFGNILMAIQNNAQLARFSIQQGEDADRSIDDILRSSKHGKDLIHRVLTFSRESEAVAQTVRVDKLVNEAIELVRAALPSSVIIRSHIDSRASVAVDPTQFQQVLMNLCANSTNAMKGGVGSITIRLESAANHEIKACGADLDNSRYAFVKLTVSDTGSGIPATILNRIFEPFFTTGDGEAGAGLGLAVTHGIVKGFGGCVTVESQSGRGSDFHVFLPVVHTSSSQTTE